MGPGAGRGRTGSGDPAPDRSRIPLSRYPAHAFDDRPDTELERQVGPAGSGHAGRRRGGQLGGQLRGGTRTVRIEDTDPQRYLAGGDPPPQCHRQPVAAGAGGAGWPGRLPIRPAA